MSQNQLKSEEKLLRKLAKKKIIKKTFLKSHFIIYVIINIFLLGLNFLINYTYTWHLWVLSGWGLGLSVHALEYSISNSKIRTKNVKFILFNIGIYVAGNVFLLFVNWFINSGTLNWFYISCFSWSWGILTLFICFSYIKFQKYHTKERMAITVHFIVYLSVNIYLYLINIVGNNYTYPWHLWALSGWGLGLIIHFMIYLENRPKKNETKKQFRERKIQKEIIKLREIRKSSNE
ncbi:MAG: 2TM domain-containing protein [Promethearchaeota archaeon]